MLGGKSTTILTVTSVLLGVSLLTVCLRCFVRLRIVKAFGWDDRLMVAAMGLNVGFALCGIVGAMYGIGRKREYFETRPDDFRSAMLCWWLGQLFYVVTCTTMRISIAIMLLRFTIERVHSWILYATMALSLIAAILFFFFTIFQCAPVTYFWDRLTIQGNCLNMDILLGIVYFYSSSAAVCDLTIGLLPAVLIWDLRLSRRTKTAISVILGIGCIASAAVIIRIPFLHSLRSPDFLYATAQVSIWSNVEANLGITAGSLAAVRPVFRMLFKGSSFEATHHSLVDAHSAPVVSHASTSYNLSEYSDSHSNHTSSARPHAPSH